MTLYEFNFLSRVQQIDAIWNLGIEIGEREDNHGFYVLYSIDSFYIELCYFDNSLKGMKTFTSTNLLDPYPTSIAIPSIIPRM